MEKKSGIRTLGFLLFTTAGLLLATKHLVALVWLSNSSEVYSYIPLIPFISAYLFWMKRKTILEQTSYSMVPGLIVSVGGVGLYGVAMMIGHFGNRGDFLSLVMGSFILWFLGGFICFYGLRAFKRALFPLGFLAFMIPIPTFILDPYITALQKASAEVSYLVFKALGVPVFRNGTVFELPGLTIEVARQCSGIRSSLALILTTLLSGYLILDTITYRILFIMAVVPIAVVKNGLRIVTISLLAAYVDKIYISSHWIHRSGGIPFFIAALFLLLFPVLWGLKVLERRRKIGQKGAFFKGLNNRSAT